MSNFKKNFQSFGKSLLFPISLLSFMAIFLGLAAALQNKNIIGSIPFLANQTVQTVLGLIRRIAGLPFGQLPLLFAMSIPLGMVKRDKGVSVYAGAVGYIAMLMGMSYVLQMQGFTGATTSVDYLMKTGGLSQVDATLRNSLFTNVLGIFVYNTNVIGGIIAGLMGVYLHNRFRETELHPSLTFYSGKRFVPIVTALVMVVVGIALTFVWPIVNTAIISMGKLISESGMFGVFLYGFTEKVINPTGLHHILNQTFRFTALGGVETVNGESLVGALQIYLYQLDNQLPFSPAATQFLAQGKILHMVFGMPAAVMAIYHSALPEKRDRVLKFFIAGVTAVILTGITEPIEFTFIFISPILLAGKCDICRTGVPGTSNFWSSYRKYSGWNNRLVRIRSTSGCSDEVVPVPYRRADILCNVLLHIQIHHNQVQCHDDRQEGFRFHRGRGNRGGNIHIRTGQANCRIYH